MDAEKISEPESVFGLAFPISLARGRCEDEVWASWARFEFTSIRFFPFTVQENMPHRPSGYSVNSSILSSQTLSSFPLPPARCIKADSALVEILFSSGEGLVSLLCVDENSAKFSSHDFRSVPLQICKGGFVVAKGILGGRSS
jgi:hypothetical protein